MPVRAYGFWTQANIMPTNHLALIRSEADQMPDLSFLSCSFLPLRFETLTQSSDVRIWYAPNASTDLFPPGWCWITLMIMKYLRDFSWPAETRRAFLQLPDSLLHKRCSFHKGWTAVQAGQPEKGLLFHFHEQYNQYALAALHSWWARLGLSFREGKCTPAWPRPVNTLMHLRSLTSIIILLHIVPVFNKGWAQ